MPAANVEAVGKITVSPWYKLLFLGESLEFLDETRPLLNASTLTL